MINLKDFRRANKLRQQVIADYLSVTRGYISLVETGASKLSEDKLAMLLANPYGWDTSLLIQESVPPTISAKASGNGSAQVSIGNTEYGVADIALLKAEIESLKIQLAEAKAEKEKYWEMIQKLMR